MQLFTRLVDLDEMYENDDTEDGLDSMMFNPVASTISKWRMYKLLRRVHLFNGLVDMDGILYCSNDIKGDLSHSKMALSPTNNF
jgi:hypothetical protein